MKNWIILLCILTTPVFAGIRWNQNKGQLKNLQGQAQPGVLFYGSSGGVDIFLTGHSIQYQYKKDLAGKDSETLFKSVVMNLVGATDPSEVVTGNPYPDFYNFFSGAERRVADHVYAYDKLLFRNVYPGIDWVVYSDKNGLKHDFIVHPGANPAQISMHYAGADEVVLQENGTIKVSNSLGYFIENEVICFQDGKRINGSYKKTGRDINFSVSGYDSGKELIIDPGVIWSTYYGGSDEDRGFAIHAAGDYYYAGGSSKSATLISTSGSYQEVYSSGLLDGWIAKFHKDGNRIWATYFGGNANDVIQAMALSGTGELIITGMTRSDNMSTPGAHQVSRGSAGSSDALLASFDTSGTLLNWSTYYGGNQDEWAFDLAIDPNNNIFICLETKSPNGTSIATAGAHQTALGQSGFSDAALVKFNASGQRVWGTYYGGTGTDAAYRMLLMNGRVAITGKTNSPNAMVLNGFQSTPGGGNDAFVSVFDTNGVHLYGTYYGGSGAEISTGLSWIQGGGLVFGGSTTSANLYVNTHQLNSGGGTLDGFLCVLDSLGQFVYGSYYGGGSYDLIASICTDATGSVYVVGSTSSINNIFDDGYQEQPISNSLMQFNTEGFIGKFNPNGTRDWGTYWGAWNDTSAYSSDQINDVVIDDDHNLALIGSTEGYLGLSVNGHQNVHGGNFDAFVSKINLSEITTTNLSDSVYCWGDTILVNYATNATFLPGNILTLELLADSFGIYTIPVAIATLATTVSQGTITGVIPQGLPLGGVYHLRVRSSNPSLVGEISNQFLTITRCISIAGTDLSNAPFCGGFDLDIPVDLIGPALNPNNVFSAFLSGPNGSFANQQFIGLVNYNNDTVIHATLPINLAPGNGYRIRVNSTSPAGIFDTGSPFQVHQPDLNLSFSIPDNQIGIPFIVQFNNNAIDPQLDYFWFFGDGTGLGSNSQLVNHQYTFAGDYPVALFAIDSVTGCRDTLFNPLDSSKTVYCTMTQPGCNLQASVTPNPTVNGCIGGNVTLTCNTGTGYSYQWNLNGLPIGGETQASLTTAIPGFYSVTIYQDSCSAISNAVQVTFNQPAVAIPQITQSDTLGYCGSNTVTLTASSGYNSYLWNTGESSQSITVNASGTYFVSGYTAALGCAQQSDTLFLSGSVVPPPSICMVTVDTTINRNLIMWEKPVTTAIDSFIIYRETAQAGVYSIIGAVDYDDLSEFIDSSSIPHIRSYRYKIGILDSCGGLSLPSSFHKTIHLQVSPGPGISRNLSWTHYEGLTFPSYEVYSGMPGTALTLLQTLPSSNNTFTDLMPMFGAQTRYYIEIVLPSACASTRAVRTRSASNTGGNPSIYLPPVWLGPVLICPDSGATGLPLNFDIQWTAVTDAGVYEIEIDDNSSFSSPQVLSSLLTEFTLNNLQSNTTYYWRVRGQNFGTSTEWSSVYSFVTGTQAFLSAPGNLLPVGGSNPVSMPDITWSPVSGADGYVITIIEDTVNTQVVSVQADDTSYTHSGNDGIYHWNIAATLCGDTSVFSDTLYFTVGPVGLNDALDADFGIIPNPNNGAFFIQLNGNWNQNQVRISVVDVSGRTVYVPTLQTNRRCLVSYPFAAGMYFVSISDGSSERVRKVLVE